jgi:CRISPR-associated protein Cas1
VGGDPIAEAVLTLLGDGSGLPTGAPLSPLLGNMFLDDFDEQIAARGGRLVRYADDFLVLTRTRHEAEAMHAETLRLVEQLELRLNDEACVLDLRDGFRFLGYDFTWEDRWRWEGPRGPVRTGDLGWRDADRVPPLSSLPLAGEEPTSFFSGVVVIGPESAELDARGGDLIVSARGGNRPIPLGGIDSIVQIGAVTWSPAVAPALLAAGVRASLVSIWGWPLGELSSSPPDDPAAILAQAKASETPERTLAIAKRFVQAKIINTASLASAIEGPDSPVAAELVRSADRVIPQADIESLRGVEGAAAREWYRLFARSLGNGFTFPGRVAPRATDPVNVMLNIGHTMLHRQAITAIRAAGLSPAIGFLHASGPRYAALAADLQEPFRHLVERAVILATRRLKPGHFMSDDDGEHPLVLQAPAAKTFHALLQRSLQATVRGDGQTDPRPWVAQLIHTARCLRAHLLAPDNPWQPFTHPRDARGAV